MSHATIANQADNEALDAAARAYRDAISKLCEQWYGAAFHKMDPGPLAALYCHIGGQGLIGVVAQAADRSHLIGLGLAIGGTLVQHSDHERVLLLNALAKGISKGLEDGAAALEPQGNA